MKPAIRHNIIAIQMTSIKDSQDYEFAKTWSNATQPLPVGV